MLPEKDQAPVSGAASGVADATPTAADNGVTAPAATTNQTPPIDVDALKTKYESDISAMKSTLQRNTAKVEKEWQSRYSDLQRQMQEVRMSTMTEEDKTRYERQLESEEFQSLQHRLTELETEREQQVQTVNAFSFFTSQGVPAEKLNLAGGYDEVVSVGWQHLTGELARLRSAASNPQPQKPTEPAPLKQAPDVVTDKGTPSSGTNWVALRAQYGTDEAVYRAVEEGRLDASIIPPS